MMDARIASRLSLMRTPAEFKGHANIGNPREFTMLKLAGEVIDLTGLSSKLEFRPLLQDDPRQRQPDISVARDELGWEPAIELCEGLKHTIGYFEQLIAEA